MLKYSHLKFKYIYTADDKNVLFSLSETIIYSERDQIVSAACKYNMTAADTVIF